MTRAASHRIELLAAALLGAVLGPHFIAASAPLAPVLELRPCRISDPQGLVTHAARCGELPVPEDPEDPQGPRITLAIAVVPAVAASARPDPLFLIAGGPGQGAREGYAASLGAWAAINRERDLVLVDQRGTGGSNRLDCDIPPEAWHRDEPSAAEIEALARDCLAALPGRAQFYTTSLAVQDLERVRAALGYPRINLFGASYGSRVAQHYVRRYPERSRAVILDSVVHPELALGPELAIAAQRALDLAFARCAADPQCNAAFPGLPAQFAALAARLRRDPVSLLMPDPVSGERAPVRVGHGQLVLASRMLAYSDRSASLLPHLIHQANSEGNLLPLAAQAEMASQSLGDMLAIGMHNSVVCSEDAPRWGTVDRAALAATFIGTIMYDGMAATCAVWPRGPVDADFAAPLDAAVPALLFAGEADPATPPEYAVKAARGFRESLLVTFAGQGHGQAGTRCAQQLMRQFIEAGSTAGLDAGCADVIRAAPPFLSATGPAP